MASEALAGLLAAIPEVDALLSAQRPLRPLERSQTARVLRRASTVVLSSHYERYIYAVNEEAIDAVNSSGVRGDELPKSLRLYHSKPAVELLSDTAWDRDTRVNALTGFVEDEAWLWAEGKAGALDASRLLHFMSAPKPDAVVRYFSYWEIPNIFDVITRTPRTKAKLRAKLLELVDKRNGIAHGDTGIVPTYHDVLEYRGVVRTFCTRADRAMSKHLQRLTGGQLPW